MALSHNDLLVIGAIAVGGALLVNSFMPGPVVTQTASRMFGANLSDRIAPGRQLRVLA